MKMDFNTQNFNPRFVLEPLFEKARKQDEFEFCCTLLRIKGLETIGWDTLLESNELIHQVLKLVQEQLDGKLKVRLLLFLYCHVTEIDDLYDVVGNLLRICLGDRYSISPFDRKLHKSGKSADSPNSKVLRIFEWANEIGFPEIGEMLNYMLVKQVRNAFFHSDYILHNNMFNIKRGKGLLIHNYITGSIPLDWLIPKLELGINFALVTIGLIEEQISSYREEKIVKARIGSNGSVEDVLITVDPEFGLSGFRSLTDLEKKKFNDKNYYKESVNQ